MASFDPARLIAGARALFEESADEERTLTAVARFCVPELADFCTVDVLEAGSFRRVGAAHVDPALETLLFEAGQRYPNRLDRPGSGQVVRTGEPQIAAEIDPARLQSASLDAEHARILARLAPRSSMILPLRGAQGVFGVLNLCFSVSGRRYEADAIETAKAIAQLASWAVENARIRSAAQRTRAEKDELMAIIETLLGQSPVGHAFVDRECRYVRINEALARMNGRSVEEHLGRRIRDILPESFATRAEAMIQDIIQTRRPVLGLELDEITIHGERRHFLASYYPVALSGRDPVGVGAVIVDVTESRRIEQHSRFLADVTTRLASVLDPAEMLREIARASVPFLGDLCIVDLLDEDRTIRRVAVSHVDPAKQKLLEQLRDEYPPRHDSPQPTARVLRSGRPELLSSVDSEVVAAHTRDRRHYDLIRAIDIRSHLAVPLVARGRTHGVICVGVTESARRYDERDEVLVSGLAARAALALDNALLYHQLQDADRLKDEFLAVLAHELRNPLAPMMNALSLAKLAPERTSRSWEVLDRQVRHMTRLVDDLLEVTRITRGKVELRREIVDLVRLAEQVAEDHRALAAPRTLRVEVEPELHMLEVVADPARMNQVIANLVANAIKFSESGEIVLRLSRGGGGGARIAVRDEGMGMDESTLKRLFQPFMQADRSLDRTRGGLGLGLALARGLVELHGGRIEGTSEGPGRGSEFVVHLPAGARGDATLAADGPPEPLPKAGRVLLIEDNRDAAETLAELLRHDGHIVRIASDGEEGIAAARAERWDAILCDLGLPRRDGYAVAREIRATSADVTLIAISGYGSAEARQHSREAGFNEHLVKPVQPHDLRRALAAAQRVPRSGSPPEA